MHGKRINCSFMDFRKAFDTVSRAKLIQRLQILGVSCKLLRGVMALYEIVAGRVRVSEGPSHVAHSKIGVKQGCPLLPTLFGLYIDEVLEYIKRSRARGAQLASTWIPLLMYANDTVLITNSPEGMQQHLEALQTIMHDNGMAINIKKTKSMVFNTTMQWVS